MTASLTRGIVFALVMGLGMALEAVVKNCCYSLQRHVSRLDPVSLFFQTEEKIYKSAPTRARVNVSQRRARPQAPRKTERIFLLEL